MFYHLHNIFYGYAGTFLTIRSMLAFLLTFLFVLVFEPKFINWFRAKHLGQPIRECGPQTHLVKKGTPTMGGLVVVAAVMLSALLLCDLTNLYVWCVLGVTLGYGVLGFIDDYRKVTVQNSKGLSARAKLYWQFGLALFFVLILYFFAPGFLPKLNIPLIKDYSIDLGIWFVPFAVLVIVGCSNAVNLTDGLDGLVIGPIMTVSFAYGVFAYVTGNKEFAEFLGLSYLSGVGDLAVFCAAMVAGGLGFLWFNSFPAQVFMGDVGALALGGGLGMLAVVTKQELVLSIAGGVFVVEALSVMAQVISFKTTGKRILRMAPLHHHFELNGLAEPKIIVRFWIISLLLAIISLLTLTIKL